MAATNIKRLSADRLATYVSAQIASLTGKCFAAHADPQESASWPSLQILPRASTFLPWQEEVVEDTSTAATIHLGTWESVFELRLSARNEREREDVEQALLDLFQQRELSPGIIVLQLDNIQVGSRTTAFSPAITYALDREDWQEELVFSQKRFSFLDIDVVMPVLVNRTPVYDIDQLILAVTEDLTTEDAEDIPVEEVSIDEDGFLSAVP